MKLKTVREIKRLNGKKVLIRVDYDVPVENERVTDDTRIKASLATIEYLVKQGAVVILVAHRGRPGGKVSAELSLEPVARKLSRLLKRKVKLLDEIEAPEVELVVRQASAGSIFLLENIRFYAGEKKNSRQLARKMAKLADVYVNDAFAVSHRKHASIDAITHYLPSYAGIKMLSEIEVLSDLLLRPKRPFVVVVGGVKISTKLKVLRKFLEIADNVLMGGALANTVLKAKGIAVGKSIIEPKMVKELRSVDLTDTKLHIPVDTVTSVELSKKTKSKIKAVGNIEDDELILDIGPDSVELFRNVISTAKTIVWNGPMGAFEYRQFSKSTKDVLQSILKSKAQVIMGGGDTIAAFNKFAPKALRKNIYLSTGGGAMLSFIEKGTLVGLEPLRK